MTLPSLMRGDAAMTEDRTRTDNPSAETDEEMAMHLAETTDISPKQARELIRRHRDEPEKLEQIAQSIKAEG
jgi:hypothetical protein